MRIYAMVSVLALIGCGNSSGGMGGMGGTGETGSQGPIGPHVTVKDKNGEVLGIALREEAGQVTVMIYKSTVAGLVDGWVLTNFSYDDQVYYLNSPLAIIWQVNGSQMLIWNPQLPKGYLYKIGDVTNNITDRNCCTSSGLCTSLCSSHEGWENRELIDTGMRYDVLGGLPWTLTIE